MNLKSEVAGVVAYADDVALVLGGGSRRDIETHANNILNYFNNKLEDLKLQISTPKTKYLILGKPLKRNPIIKLKEQKIERVSIFKYLGVTLDEKLNFSEHIRTAVEKTIKISNKLIRIAKSNFGLPPGIIKRYHGSIINGVLNYGASVWSHRLNENVALQTKVNRAQRLALLRLSGAYRTTPTESLNIILNILPSHLDAIKRGARYWFKHDQPDRVRNLLGTNINNLQELDVAIIELWNKNWKSLIKNKRTHDILPDVKHRMELNWEPGPGMVQFISGHGPYRERLFKSKSVNSPHCGCGPIGTAEHVILECPLPAAACRQQYIDIRNYIKDKLKADNLKTLILDETFRINLAELAEEITRNLKSEFLNREGGAKRAPGVLGGREGDADLSGGLGPGNSPEQLETLDVHRMPASLGHSLNLSSASSTSSGDCWEPC